jgi:magnesium-transporting ATPase (P-type)
MYFRYVMPQPITNRASDTGDAPNKKSLKLGGQGTSLTCIVPILTLSLTILSLMSQQNRPTTTTTTTSSPPDTAPVLQQYQSRLEGLSSPEAEQRLEQYGANILPSKPPPTVFQIFIQQFLNPLIYVLLAAAVVSALLQEWIDAAFIGVVLLFNAVIGTYQEWRAARSAEALQNLIKAKVRVRRDGKVVSVPAEELVPGDVVLLESGNRVPADMQLLQSYQLKVDEAFLTGESEPIEKNTAPIPEGVPVLEQRNRLFAGSTVFSGRAVGLVIGTAANTEIGHISKSLQYTTSGKPPLVIRIERFSHQITYYMLGVTALLALLAFAKGYPTTEIFFISVALAVAAIPEGLPIAITVALSIGTWRMSQRNVIVRKLTAVEGLGSCTFIASDKTGTLTVNQQTLRRVVLPQGQVWQISGEGYSGEGEALPENTTDEDSRPALNYVARLGALANEGSLEKRGTQWQGQGDAMDVAILALGHKVGVLPADLKSTVKVQLEIPYESERKYAGLIYDTAEGRHATAKGALETLLPCCNAIRLPDGGSAPLDAAAITAQADALTAQGYRVLAVVDGLIDATTTPTENSLQDLQFIGLLGFIDPLRPEAAQAVADCKRAGVQVGIVTGDHPLTALAIAQELGIAKTMDEVVTGAALAEIADTEGEEFAALIGQKRVFARVSPLQKMQIVTALQNHGHFVAVTGDGVNDVPALKKAHIGVAMGSGTDLAKETAEIIVTDDNFASIKAGIEGGRHAYDNIRKVIYLLIATGAAEIMLFVCAILANTPMPLTAVQLLWVNLVTNGIQDIALAFEGREPENMRKPPRKPSEGIFDKLMISQTLIVGSTMGLTAFAAWYWMMQAGYETIHARNLVLMLLVFIENVQVFNCRSERSSVFRVPLSRNWYILGGVALAQGIHIAAMQSEWMRTILGVDMVTLHEWGTMLIVALAVLVVSEIFKLIIPHTPLRCEYTQER